MAILQGGWLLRAQEILSEAQLEERNEDVDSRPPDILNRNEIPDFVFVQGGRNSADSQTTVSSVRLGAFLSHAYMKKVLVL